MNVLHVLNYGWPYIDGYTARSIGLVNAQANHLDGVTVSVAVSPFQPLAHGRDTRFETPHWAPSSQLVATRYREGSPIGVRRWERPAVGLSPVTSGMFAEALTDIVRGQNIDLIHVHHPHYVANVALQVARACNIPGVYELRCFNGYYDLGKGNLYATLRGHWQNHKEFALARAASATVTISDALAQTLRRRGVAADRLFVVRNSVDTSRFTAASQGSAPPVAPSEAPAQRADTVFRVGYATTFERMENLDSAVRAACIAQRELATSGITLQLILAGTGRDWSRIQALVSDLGAERWVRLPGLIPYADMPDFYRSLDLFLVPRGDSLVATDTTPLKPLEALACGLPLLVTSLPAMRELLADREDVRFCDVDAESMAAGLLAFARAPWRGAGHLNGRAWDTEVQRYGAVYARACAQGPPALRNRLALMVRARRLLARGGVFTGRV